MAATEDVAQVNAEQLATMSPAAIQAAYQAGQLAELLGAPIPVRVAEDAEQVTADELRRLTPHQVGQAHAAGQLAALLTTNSEG